MKSSINPAFRKRFAALPRAVQEQARNDYRLFMADPRHGSLHFKQIHGGICSARVGISYRVVGVLEDGEVTWFWIGSHAEYDELLRRL